MPRSRRVRHDAAKMGTMAETTWIRAMNATNGDLPEDDSDWQFEPKWDGMRALVRVSHGTVQARSRTDRDITVEFPELAGLGGVVESALLDGELVALDESGRASFSRLQQRFGVSDPTQAAARSRAVPAVYVVFDLLSLDGEEIWRRPLAERRALLVDTVEPGAAWQVTAAGAGHGAAWLDAARSQQLEGVMAKRLDAAYQPGRRSDSWRKVKLRHAQEFLVCGWTPGTGRRDRDDALGALVLGCHGSDGLRWVGNVGTGLTSAELRRWRAELDEAEVQQCPFSPDTLPGTRPRALATARWVRPVHVVQVAYAEWTPDRRLRHPSLLGRRPDVDAAAVRCEE